MKVEKPQNENYAAIVVKVKSITTLEGCDNVVGTPLLGFQAIVAKDTEVGDVGIVFPAESQLSEEYAHHNSLFRHGSLNADEGAKGYLEDNRRVKAMKFRGHRSDCLFMPLSSLGFTSVDVSELKEGDTFDVLGTHRICQKYVVERPVKETGAKKVEESFVRVGKAFMPEHFSTTDYFRNSGSISDDTLVTITQKLHGTSVRIGHTIVQRKLGFLERVARALGVKVAETEFDYVFGSRHTIKDINNPYQNHFYSRNLHVEEGRKLEGVLPQNFLAYGELIGWESSGKAIQKSYTYRVPEGTCELYVYRIAFVNGQGRVIDLAWDQVKEFCRDHGLRHVPELWRGLKKDFNAEFWLDKKYADLVNGGVVEYAVPLADESPCDEGVCIRVDGLTPFVLKAKSPEFRQHESKMNDQGVVDLETEDISETT